MFDWIENVKLKNLKSNLIGKVRGELPSFSDKLIKFYTGQRTMGSGIFIRFIRPPGSHKT